MATFRTFRPSFWDDNYIAELSASEKLVYIYFFTNSEINNLGVARLTPRKVAFYTGLSLEEVKEAFTKLSNDKKIYVFEETVWVVNFIKNQTYTSPKIRTGLKNLLAKVEIVSLWNIIIKHYPWLNEDLQKDTKRDKEIKINAIDTLSIPYEYPTNTLPIPHEYPIDGMRNVECRNNNNIYTTATDVVVEKGGVGENKTDASASYCGDYCGGDEEQESRLELRADNPSPSKGKVLTLTMPLSREVVEIPIKRSHVPYEDMQRLYNTVVAAENGAGNSPTRCLRLDDKRRKVLAKAWNETPYMPWFEEYARMVRDSCPFLMGKEAGRNGRFFKLDIAQFFRSDIITKALEGKYRTRYDGALTLEQVFDIWNEKLAPRGFDRAVILGTETERRDKLRTILDEFDNTVAAVGGAEKFFRALCDVATADPWCCGENKQQRKITVNFFLEPRSVARLIQTSLS